MFAESRGKGLNELLEMFARLRAENLAELRALGLSPAGFERTGLHPELGVITLRQLLATWVVHDLDHLGQIARVMAKAYGDEVGPWRAYVSILKDRAGDAQRERGIMTDPDRLPTIPALRVVLRHLTEDDVDALFAIFSNPEVMRYWSTLPMTDRSEALDLLEHVHGSFRRGTLFQWGVARRGDDLVIGTCTLFNFETDNRRAEIGYALGREHWGQGYMREALEALLGYAFGELDLQRLEADVDPRNSSSIRSRSAWDSSAKDISASAGGSAATCRMRSFSVCCGVSGRGGALPWAEESRPVGLS